MSQKQSPDWNRLSLHWPQLVNPPLLISTAAESLAGALLVGASPNSLAPYVLAGGSALLFGAGSVFGHCFDFPRDRTAFPGRPLPAGTVTPGVAWRLALALLCLGALLLASAILLLDSFFAPALAALGLLTLVSLHAAWTKSLWGPCFLTLGAARSANLLLGMSVKPELLAAHAPAALPVLLYGVGWGVLRAVTQPGTPPSARFAALIHLTGAFVVVLYQLQWVFEYPLALAPFLVGALAVTLPRVVAALLDGRRAVVREAVQWGFLGLTGLEAALAAGSGGLSAGILVAILCVPLYFALGKWPLSLATTPR